MVQVTDLDELADTAALLARGVQIGGDRIGILSLAGGGTGLLADIAADYGFTVPELAPATIAGLGEILPRLPSLRTRSIRPRDLPVMRTASARPSSGLRLIRESTPSSSSRWPRSQVTPSGWQRR